LPLREGEGGGGCARQRAESHARGPPHRTRQTTHARLPARNPSPSPLPQGEGNIVLFALIMFAKLLIANRGEIACRVMRTARRLGIRTVAVYSDADAGALHVAMADEAVRIGPPAAKESYLNIDAVIDAVHRTGVAAIHPGYGSLPENAAFARACAEADVVFVGPPASAIRAMGSKSEAKAIMGRAGVPLVPGYHGDDQQDADLQRAAGRTGYPVLIKAV